MFFAQHHVLPPESPLFKLVGNLEALIKVHVYSETGARAPGVFAIVDLDSKTLELLSLEGTGVIDEYFTDRSLAPHSSR